VEFFEFSAGLGKALLLLLMIYSASFGRNAALTSLLPFLFVPRHFVVYEILFLKVSLSQLQLVSAEIHPCLDKSAGLRQWHW
jgi:hypothetical protein